MDSGVVGGCANSRGVRVVLHPYTPQPVNRRIWGAQQANPRGLGGQPDWNPLIFDILAAAVIALAPVKQAPDG
jgi:hypothetical protein